MSVGAYQEDGDVLVIFDEENPAAWLSSDYSLPVGRDA